METQSGTQAPIQSAPSSAEGVNAWVRTRVSSLVRLWHVVRVQRERTDLCCQIASCTYASVQNLNLPSHHLPFASTRRMLYKGHGWWDATQAFLIKQSYARLRFGKMLQNARTPSVPDKLQCVFTRIPVCTVWSMPLRTFCRPSLGPRFPPLIQRTIDAFRIIIWPFSTPVNSNSIHIWRLNRRKRGKEIPQICWQTIKITWTKLGRDTKVPKSCGRHTWRSHRPC